MELVKYNEQDLKPISSDLTYDELNYLINTGLPDTIVGLKALNIPEVDEQKNIILYRENPNKPAGSRDGFIFIHHSSRKLIESDETLHDIDIYNNNLVNSSLFKLLETQTFLENWMQEVNWDFEGDNSYKEYEKFKTNILNIDEEFCQFWFNYVTNLEDFTD